MIIWLFTFYLKTFFYIKNWTIFKVVIKQFLKAELLLFNKWTESCRYRLSNATIGRTQCLIFISCATILLTYILHKKVNAVNIGGLNVSGFAVHNHILSTSTRISANYVKKKSVSICTSMSSWHDHHVLTGFTSTINK